MSMSWNSRSTSIHALDRKANPLLGFQAEPQPIFGGEQKVPVHFQRPPEPAIDLSSGAIQPGENLRSLSNWALASFGRTRPANEAILKNAVLNEENPGYFSGRRPALSSGGRRTALGWTHQAGSTHERLCPRVGTGGSGSTVFKRFWISWTS